MSSKTVQVNVIKTKDDKCSKFKKARDREV